MQLAQTFVPWVPCHLVYCLIRWELTLSHAQRTLSLLNTCLKHTGQHYLMQHLHFRRMWFHVLYKLMLSLTKGKHCEFSILVLYKISLNLKTLKKCEFFHWHLGSVSWSAGLRKMKIALAVLTIKHHIEDCFPLQHLNGNQFH